MYFIEVKQADSMFEIDLEEICLVEIKDNYEIKVEFKNGNILNLHGEKDMLKFRQEWRAFRTKQIQQRIGNDKIL